MKQTLVDLAQKAWDANIKEDAEFYRNFLIDEAFQQHSRIQTKPTISQSMKV